MQTRSGTALCGDVELFYEDLGDPDAPPVLLIMGVGAQLPMWPDGFCERLVGRATGSSGSTTATPVFRPSCTG